MLQGIEPIEPAVLAELSRTMRSFLEIGYWQGLGSEKQPMGIASLPNTTTETFNASTPTWVEVLSMIDKYLDNHSDFGKATFFAHPALLTELMATPKASSTAAFIAEPGPAPRTAQIAGIPVFTSTAVPSGKLYLMDPTRVNLVRWDAPQLIADRTTAGKSISGAAELIVLDAVDLIVTNPAEVVVGGAAS